MGHSIPGLSVLPLQQFSPLQDLLVRRWLWILGPRLLPRRRINWSDFLGCVKANWCKTERIRKKNCKWLLSNYVSDSASHTVVMSAYNNFRLERTQYVTESNLLLFQVTVSLNTECIEFCLKIGYFLSSLLFGIQLNTWDPAERDLAHQTRRMAQTTVKFLNKIRNDEWTAALGGVSTEEIHSDFHQIHMQ